MKQDKIQKGCSDVCIHLCIYLPIILANLPLCMCFSITPAEMAPFTEQLLTNLFKALALPGSAENEYIMKGKPDFPPSASH